MSILDVVRGRIYRPMSIHRKVNRLPASKTSGWSDRPSGGEFFTFAGANEVGDKSAERSKRDPIELLVEWLF